jgi:putative oxidoreductase
LRRVIDNDWLTLLARLAVGVTFIYASYYKIVDPTAFAKSIWYYHLLPGSLINPAALVVPWVELLVGLALIVGIHYRGAVLLVNGLTVVFVMALASAIARGLSIDCGCFKAGATATEEAWNSLFFDLGLLVCTVWLLASRSRKWMIAAE